MHMMKIPAGMIVKQIIDEKRLRAADVADKMGISRQAVYQSYAKMVFSDTDITNWSNALGIHRDEFIKRYQSANNSKHDESTSFDASKYLTDHLMSLESEFKVFTEQAKALTEQLQNQLAVKDRQIEKLMDLLGKPNPAVEESKVLELWPSQAAQA
jgi:transcriptional regulator with XRE-family HTH domain